MKQNFLKRIWKEYKAIFVFLFFVFIIRGFIFNWYVVPSGSMYPTLKIGQYIFTNRLAYGLGVPFYDTKLFTWDTPSKGDVVITYEPGNGNRIVKRVVAVGGDTLEIRDNNLILNGVKASYLEDKNLTKEPNIESIGYKEVWSDGRTNNILKTTQKLSYTPIRNGIYHIPKDKVMLMGDNRDNSKDSRYFGFVDIKNIEGKVINDGQ